MINKLTRLSEELAESRKSDPLLLERMEIAAQGQSPKYLIISSIERSSQDLEIFGFRQGDAFHATRVPYEVVPTPDQSPFLFAGPAAYNRHFEKKRAVVLPFGEDEPIEVVRQSLENIGHHPDIRGLPIVVFRVRYDIGRAYVFPHGLGRDYAAENELLRRTSQPREVDNDTLVLLCSDSRVQPPVTPRGIPMAIQTLGAHISAYNPEIEECIQLDKFFEKWLSVNPNLKKIIVVAHGNFEGDGPSCGAGSACMNPSDVEGDYLCPVIKQLHEDASRFEKTPAKNPEERVVSLAQSTVANLLTYLSVKKESELRSEENLLIDIILMDTVSNVLTTTGL